MKKIPCVFVIDTKEHKVLPKLNPVVSDLWEEYRDEQRVIMFEKHNGVAIKLSGDGVWSERVTLPAKSKAKGFVQVCTEPNGMLTGWMPLKEGSKYDKAIKTLTCPNETLTAPLDEPTLGPLFPDGTYELCGPGICGNQYNLEGYELRKHFSDDDVQTMTYYLKQEPALLKAQMLEALNVMESRNMEGLVFYRNDEPYAKLRTRDIRSAYNLEDN